MTQATAFPHEYVKAYLELIAGHFPGETTLNQLRILQYIGMRCSQGKGHTSHKEICEALGLTPSMVTRAVAAFMDAGVLREETDPADGRRRFVSLNPNRPGNGNLNAQVVTLAHQHFVTDRRSPD
jgi:DNA-binding MarR family transcriptional regulator